jgi:hypothetical protein
MLDVLLDEVKMISNFYFDRVSTESVIILIVYKKL